MATSTDGYALLKTITLPGGVGGHGDWVTYDADTKTIWLAQSPDNNVVVIDTTTNSIKAVIPNIGNANGIALNSQYAFVADVTNNTVDVIDKRTFQVVAKVPQTGTTPDSTTYISSTNQVAVASDDANVEDFLNATSPFTQTASISLQPNPSVNGPDVSVYVASKDLIYQPNDTKVDVINPHTGAIVTVWTLLSTGSVKPGVYDPVTNTFLFGTTNKQMLVVNADTGAVIKTIAIPGSVDETAIDVNARLAFVGDKAGGIDVINLDSQTVVGTLPAEVNVHTLTVDPTTHEVYVYENNRNTVDVYAPAPSAPTYTSQYVSSTANLVTTPIDQLILSGGLQLRGLNADGSTPTVAAGTGGVLTDSVGGKLISLPSTYNGAYLTGTASDALFGGGGLQAIVSGSAGSELVLNGGVNFVAAGGNNVIFDTNDTAYLALDNGNNTVVENGSQALINAGTGTNLIGVNAGSAGHSTSASILSTGNDTVLQTGGSATVDASYGASTAKEAVFVSGGLLSFIGGAGAATVVGGASGTEFVRGGSGTLLASGTASGGNVLAGGTGNATLFGGGNGDVLVAGSGTNLLVAGAGNETLEGAFSGYVVSGNNTYFAGPGNDVITTGKANDTVFAGSGQATVNIGAGADLIAITSGRAGNNLVLNNFNQAAGDRISLQGYGANTAANAVAQQTVSNGSAVLSLGDGTKLTFAGVSSVSTNSFV